MIKSLLQIRCCGQKVGAQIFIVGFQHSHWIKKKKVICLNLFMGKGSFTVAVSKNLASLFGIR
jgi:hypothetical protein